MKTVFFVLPGKRFVRDLLLLPGGVFQLLERKKDVRVVIIVAKSLYKKYESNFDGLIKYSNRVVVETIDTYYPSTRLHKAFMFFVKYLIFTDSMRLIAQEGVRVDVPIAGGRKYLYVVKLAIFHLFGHSKWIKQVLVPKLFFRVFSERPYQKLFEKYKPDVMFTADIKPFFTLMLLAEAKRKKVRNIQMPGNWDHFKYYLPLQSDVMLVDNEPLKEEAVELENYKDYQVFVTGFPRFDYFLNEKNLKTRKEYVKECGFPEDSKIVLFMSEGVYARGGGDIVGHIIEGIKKGELDSRTRVVVRPYPPYPGPWGEFEEYGRFENEELAYINSLPIWRSMEQLKNLMNMLYHADVVITTYSTGAVEAAAYGRPVINIGFDGDKDLPMHKSVRRFVHIDHFKHLTRTGGVKTVTSKEEFLSDLKEYLSNKDFRKKERDAMRERMCFIPDMKASERIVKHIEKNLHG